MPRWSGLINRGRPKPNGFRFHRISKFGLPKERQTEWAQLSVYCFYHHSLLLSSLSFALLFCFFTSYFMVTPFLLFFYLGTDVVGERRKPPYELNTKNDFCYLITAFIM